MLRAPRMCFLATHFDSIGGAQVHVRDMAAEVARKGVDVSILYGGTSGAAVMEKFGVHTQMFRVPGLQRRISPIRDLSALRQLEIVLAQCQPDLVSTHSSKAGWLGRLVCKRLGVPVIFTAHGWAFTEGVGGLARRIYLAAERRAGHWADHVITVSEYDRRLALRSGVVAKGGMTTIHNGMPDVAESLRAAPATQPPVLVMVARMDAQKDHLLLLSALSQLTALDWTLKLVGDGENLQHIRARIAQLGLGGRTDLLGSRPDVPAILRDAQLFVLATKWEGFPRSILEAMRAGLPVVASDVAGVSESVVNEESGFLVARGDAGALADRLRTLIQNPLLRARMGQEGRNRYERHFTFGHMVKKTVSVYRDVLQERGRATQATWFADAFELPH